MSSEDVEQAVPAAGRHPRSRRLIAALLLAACLGTPGVAQESEPPPIVRALFEVDPPAQVWRRDGEGNYDYVGPSGRTLTLDLDRQEAAGGRDLVIDFRLQLWNQTWTSPAEYISVSELRKDKRFPAQGAHRLDLTTGQRLQAFSRSHLPATLLILVLPMAGALLFWKRRALARALQAREDLFDYAVGERLGAGAMGEVFAATSGDGLECALKFLRPEVRGKTGAAERFDREIAASVELSHPHLLRVFGYGFARDGRLYLATERLYGETLKEVLKRGTEDPAMLALRVAEQMGAALSYLHERGVMHRDVKPENIFVRQGSGALVLMDLGLAQDVQMESFTVAGKAMGTPAYMSPEQVRGKPCLASDQYGLGVVLYEVLTRKRPFRGLDPASVAHQQIHETPQPLRELEPSLSAEAEEVVLRMLSKQTESRFPSVAEATLALRQALGHAR